MWLLNKGKLPPEFFVGTFSTINWTWIAVTFGVIGGYGLGNLGAKWIDKRGGDGGK